MFLTPLTAVLTTMKYFRLGDRCPVRVKDDGNQTDGGESRDQHASPDVNLAAGT